MTYLPHIGELPEVHVYEAARTRLGIMGRIHPLDVFSPADAALAAADREAGRLEWQRDKAARVAGIDISELDVLWDERGAR